MASGGARNRSGPAPDPNSGRSDARGLRLTALPASYDGPVPEFPLPGLSVREAEVWAETWRLPQANAWSLPSESWRVRTVAMWVRLSVRCEDPDASASLLGQLHRFADQVGLTTAGLAEMGWQVAADEVSPRAAADRPGRVQERRLRVASGDAQ
jgi:hypothetical protein